MAGGDGRRRRPAGLASWLPGCELTLAYPGLWLDDGVYATHGQYLDLHLTVPRLESIAASAVGRLSGRRKEPRRRDDFEAVLAPIYGFYAGMAQGASARARSPAARRCRARSGARAATGDGASAMAARVLLGRVTIPGAVATLNRLRIGPFSPT